MAEIKRFPSITVEEPLVARLKTFPAYTDGLPSTETALEILDTNPVNPFPGSAWILRTPTLNAISYSGMPWGLLLNGSGFTYELYYYSTDGEYTITPLENP